jgi:3-oxoacyl-[acyl-carrier-protein] synthase II
VRRVVITGLGMVTAVGNTVDETWSAILAGKSGAAPIDLFDASAYTTQFAAAVKNFQIGDYIGSLYSVWYGRGHSSNARQWH